MCLIRFQLGYVKDSNEAAHSVDTVEPRLSGLVGTRRNSPDNRKYES